MVVLQVREQSKRTLNLKKEIKDGIQAAEEGPATPDLCESCENKPTY